MLSCRPFLLFDGNCAEAMTFYHACLGGALTLTRLRDTPMMAQFPPTKHDRIIHARIDGAVAMTAADWMASPGLEPVRGNMSAIFVVGETHDEVQAVFDKLAVGANRDRFQQLHDMPFGTFGQFYDRYDVQWIFVIPRIV